MLLAASTRRTCAEVLAASYHRCREEGPVFGKCPGFDAFDVYRGGVDLTRLLHDPNTTLR